MWRRRWRSRGRRGIDSVTLHCQYAAMPDDERYSLTELADLAGVTPRTVRYYLAQGLLPAVGPTGPGSKYDAGHLARLRLIRRLQAEHLPLAEIRRRLETLDDGGDPRARRRGASRRRRPDTALEYLRTVLGGPPAVRAVPPPRAGSVALRPDRRAATRARMPSAGARRAIRRGASCPDRLHARRAAAATAAGPGRTTVRPATAPSGNGSCSRRMSNSTSGARCRGRRTKQVDRLVTIARELLEEDRS